MNRNHSIIFSFFITQLAPAAQQHPMVNKSIPAFTQTQLQNPLQQKSQATAQSQIPAFTKSHFVWNYNFIMSCTAGVPSNILATIAQEQTPFDATLYKNIQPYDIIFVRCDKIPEFYRTVFLALRVPILLVVVPTHSESFPSDISHHFDVEQFLSDSRIVHIFAQNNDYQGNSDKVSHLPLGIDFHSIAYKNGGRGCWGQRGTVADQENALAAINATLRPTYARKIGAYVDFQLNDQMRNGVLKSYLRHGEDRTSIFKTIIQQNKLSSTHNERLIDYPEAPLPRYALWQKKGEYAFSISPHGNGLDCHRTWEDLVLGCIVIVKTSPLDPLYEGLPVVIIKDWTEITCDNMQRWLIQYGDAFTNPKYREKLTHNYWARKILDCRARAIKQCELVP